MVDDNIMSAAVALHECVLDMTGRNGPAANALARMRFRPLLAGLYEECRFTAHSLGIDLEATMEQMRDEEGEDDA